eukprot:350168-Chlamydomonas_euryale.AAC.1
MSRTSSQDGSWKPWVPPTTSKERVKPHPKFVSSPDRGRALTMQEIVERKVRAARQLRASGEHTPAT